MIFDVILIVFILTMSFTLTHWGRMTHTYIYVYIYIYIYASVNWGNISSDTILVLERRLRNRLQWNLKRNLYIFIEANAFENVIWWMVAISSRPQYVNSYLNKFHHSFCWCNIKRRLSSYFTNVMYLRTVRGNHDYIIFREVLLLIYAVTTIKFK